MAGNLLTADGAIHNDIIEQNARAFTLDYMRHTILGTPRGIDSESIHGPLIVPAQRSGLLLSAADEKLIVTPDAKEMESYHSHKPQPTPHVEQLNEGFLLERFHKYFNKANVGKYVSAELELLRTAISIQMERVLDAAQANDQEAFDPAYRELENSMTAGFRTLLPKLLEAGVPPSEADKALHELTEHAIGGAIDKRAASIEEESDRPALCSHYEDLLNAYRDKQHHFSEDMAQQRQTAVARLKAQEPKAKPLHSSLSCVRWDGRNLMPESPKYRWPDNNNESSR